MAMSMVLVTSLMTSTAAAQPEPAATPAPEAAKPLPSGPYPLPVMIGDAVGVALFAGGYALAVASEDCACEELGSGYLLMFGIATCVGVPAMVHDGQHRRGRAVASVALRVGLPIAAGYTADALGHDRTTTFADILGGAGAAMLLDWTVLTRVRTHRTPPPTVSLFAAPALAGALAGLAGRW